jgi:hypothetical protein
LRLGSYWEKLHLSEASENNSGKNSFKFNRSSLNSSYSYDKGYTTNSISFRGHTSEYVKSEDKLVVYGGIKGINKYNNLVYEINLKVQISLIFIIEK